MSACRSLILSFTVISGAVALTCYDRITQFPNSPTTSDLYTCSLFTSYCYSRYTNVTTIGGMQYVQTREYDCDNKNYCTWGSGCRTTNLGQITCCCSYSRCNWGLNSGPTTTMFSSFAVAVGALFLSYFQ